MARKPDLSEKVIEEIKKMISNNMKPGDQMPTETELISILGVSRSTVRESLRVLSTLGLIVRRNGGTYVNSTVSDCLVEPLHIMLDLEIGSVSDLLELRNLLELDVIRIVAEKISDDAIHGLEKSLWMMQNPDASEDDFQKQDIIFHSILARFTGNAVLIELLNSLRKIIAVKQAETCKIQPIQEKVIASHQRLLMALKNHDAEKAIAYMKEHLKISHAFYGFSLQHISSDTNEIDALRSVNT